VFEKIIEALLKLDSKLKLSRAVMWVALSTVAGTAAVTVIQLYESRAVSVPALLTNWPIQVAFISAAILAFVSWVGFALLSREEAQRIEIQTMMAMQIAELKSAMNESRAAERLCREANDELRMRMNKAERILAANGLTMDPSK
jgi:hypothetical protein